VSGGAFFTGLGAPSLTNGSLTLPGSPSNPATGTVVNPIAPVTAQGLTQNAPIVGRQPTAPQSAGPVTNADGTVALPMISVGPAPAPIEGPSSQQSARANTLPPTTGSGNGSGGSGSSGSADGSGTGTAVGSGTDTGGGSGGTLGSDGTGGEGGSGVTGPTGFVDNPLNGYRQVAYHFKLYCAGDTGQGNQVIIAETGKTGFNIREVHITSYVAPNSQTVNSVATEMTMVITEPTGVAFLDALYIAASASGVKNNWNTCPYLLDLWFTGYNEDGSVAPVIQQGMPNSGKLTWKLNIQNIDTVLETAGAVYTLHCVIMHDWGLVPEFGSTQANHTVTGKTVKEVCDNLANEVNKKILQDYKEQIAKFEFVFHGGGQSSGPNPQGFQIKQQGTAGQVDPLRLFEMSQDNKEQPTANVVRGTQLTQFVDQVIGATTDGQSLAWYGKTGGDLSKPPSGGKFTERVHYRVYPEVTYTGGYNQTYGQYIRTVKLHVKPYKTQVTVLDAQEAANAGKDAWNAVQPRTRKKYEYIFTGLNTEVISFDLKFTLNWGGNLPRFSGWEMQNEMVEHHALYDKDGAANLKAFTQAKANAQQGAAQASAGQTALSAITGLASGNLAALGTNAFTSTLANSLGDKLNAGLNSITGTNVAATPAQTVAQQALGAFTSNGGAAGAGGTAGISSALTQIQQGNILASSSEANLKALAAAQRVSAQNSGTYQTAASGTFAEDLLGSSSAGGLPYVPVTLAQAASAPQRANGSGFLGQRGLIGRSVYGALLDQLYFPEVFSKISLTVRGDPFWLGGSYENNFKDTSNDSNSADFTQGDTCFALVFKYPYGVSDTTGQPVFKPQNTFNGAYRATIVVHDFVDGKFTQTIEAIRLAKVDPNTVNSAVASASSSPASTSTAASNGGTLTSTPSSTTPTTPTTTTPNNAPMTNAANTLQTSTPNTGTPSTTTQPNTSTPSPTPPVTSTTPNATPQPSTANPTPTVPLKDLRAR
jgi:hypothetical protein